MSEHKEITDLVKNMTEEIELVYLDAIIKKRIKKFKVLEVSKKE